MFEELKVKILKKSITRILISLVVCIILVVINMDAINNLLHGPKSFISISEDKMEGAYVKGDFSIIFDSFCEYYEEDKYGTKETKSNYYIIPFGEEQYMAIKFPNQYTYRVNQIVDDSYAYMNGDINDLTNMLSVKGTIHKMSSEEFSYFEDFFKESGWETGSGSDFEKIALPYVLDVDYIGKSEDFMVYMMLFVGGLIMAYIAFTIIRIIIGSNLTSIRKFIRKSEDRYIFEKLEEDYLSGEKIGQMVIGKNYTFYFTGCSAKLLPNEDILWAYQETITQRYYFIKVGVSRFLHLKTRNKRDNKITIKKVDYVNAVLSQYSVNCPNMLLGFSESNKKAYKEMVANYKKQKNNSNIDYYHQDNNTNSTNE